MNYFKRTAFLLVLMLFAANFSFAQSAAQPRQEKLLNGLKVLIWNEPKAEKVSLRLRIHSGSAFDPKDKMGTMALLTDILFPTEQTKNFFEEDLEGSLEVTSNYDYIQINATAKSDEFLTILETIATVVSNPAISQENFVKVRDARLKAVEEMQKNPAYIADRAIAKRLLGDFPYGRPADGTPESLKLIERADLLTAKDKFFTADNATLAITGSVKHDFAYMAARRLFGAWKKADKLVPATFRQPDDPDTKVLSAELPAGEKEQIMRFALRGLARNDKDFWASAVLFKILQNRSLDEFKTRNSFIRHEARLLPGLIVFGSPVQFEVPNGSQPPKPLNFIGKRIQNAISAAEFEKAKAEILDDFNKKNATELWLDVDTYKLASVKDDAQNAKNIALEDVQRTFERLKTAPEVIILFSPKAATGESTPPKN